MSAGGYAAVVIAALVLLTALLFLISYVLFRVGVRREYKNRFFKGGSDIFARFRDKIREELEWFASLSPERVSIVSYDGLTLAAQYLPAEESRGTLLLMNGYRSLGSRDFACALRLYHSLGYDILLPDQRACGASGGEYITFGVRERFDCVSWVEYINSRFGADRPVFLNGISMGATTVLCASALGLPKNVRGIVADCGFTSPRAIMKSVLHRMLHLPCFPFMPIAEIFCRRMAGFGFDECSTVEAMAKNTLPVLFVHGKADAFVPYEMTVECYNACRAEKRLLLAEGAGHGQSFVTEHERYERMLVEFLDRHT